MKTLQRYVLSGYVSAFLLGMVVLTFVLSIGLLVKATQLVIKGLEPSLILNFLAVSIPESFSFTIPLSVLVSALLVFGRLSSDGETSAMRACGINIWTVVAPLALFGILLASISIFVNSYVAPRGYLARHLIATGAKGMNAVKLLEPGRFIDEFPGMTVRFARKEGDVLYDLLIYDRSNPDFTREIRAESAIVTVNEPDMTLDMRSVRIDPFSETQPGAATADRLVHTLKGVMTPAQYRPRVGGLLNGELRNSIADNETRVAEWADRIERRYSSVTNSAAELMRAREELAMRQEEASAISNRLVAAGLGADAMVTDESYSNALVAVASAKADEENTNKAKNVYEAQLAGAKRSKAEAERKISEMRTEFSRRFALGVAPVIFLLIGIPLGMRTSRRESNIGATISLGIMILYYAFLILAKSVAKRPEFQPHILIWVPSVVCLVLAVILIRRNR